MERADKWKKINKKKTEETVTRENWREKKTNNGTIFSKFKSGGSTGERDSEDGRPLSLVNRRPSISAPISSRKPSGSSRVHTPPPASPGFLGDGASSTPKRLSSEGMSIYSNPFFYFSKIEQPLQKGRPIQQRHLPSEPYFFLSYSSVISRR